ncbi:hypothetical protein DV735_g3355, partial [Chaetothyriales sp. CBS 134920]
MSDYLLLWVQRREEETPIEAKSVHQIQSGQVIVDLCSVVKELVENSLDAGATSIEVRFKNNGLDAIEVQDNGSGISPANYANVALKHYTSKLSHYNDLSTLRTFGFRGEALSSLCALSHFAIVTAQADQVPRGSRLEFDASGAFTGATTTPCQRGTTAIVEGLFAASLPVRRKELSKNIKREYGKVLGLLHAYACVGVNVKFTVKNTAVKGKTTTTTVFSTKGNATTRENIANVYGARTLQALAPLDLDLDSPPSLTNVRLVGHISRPVFGDGRQTPDRQMFFVNGRPCGLPQIAKAINEVYKSFNVSQSPFVFADFIMDTNAYDVNVSPDKRSIMLHNAAALIERLKTCLTDMFDQHEQTAEDPSEDSPNQDHTDPRQIHVRDFNRRIAEQQSPRSGNEDAQVPTLPIPTIASSPLAKEPRGVVQSAFERMRPKRTRAEIATITVDGETTTTTVIGSQFPRDEAVFKRARVGRLLPHNRSAGKAPRGSASFSQSLQNDDSDYVDDSEKKAREEARVADLIRQAEESAMLPSQENIRRANKALKGGRTKHSTFNLSTSMGSSLRQLRKDMALLKATEQDRRHAGVEHERPETAAKDEEARLSLTVSKADFSRMRVVGQFNLGFILAVRPKTATSGQGEDHSKDELFIIDQHASDEKFNFERLQAETVIGNQPMVRPVTLSLTAVEEEILLENAVALQKNGFVVQTDTSGASPIGRRCTLTSLPVSKETTFDTRDMDELIHMLAEAPMLGTESAVPRPSRVRKMFAMRACRSSIMIGKTLSLKQMTAVVRHMGTIDKPWNCPHGRPTMRHVTTLDNVETWQEGWREAASGERTDGIATVTRKFSMAPSVRSNATAAEFRDKEEYHEDKAKGAMLRFEDSLPRLPVPSLEETTKKYLKSLHPLLSKEEYAESEKAVAEFTKAGGIGQKLQERLIARAQDPNTKNWIIDWWNEAAYLGYRDPVVPYQYMFNGSRVAALPSDYPIVYGPEGNEHIIVVRKNQFWKVPTHVDGKQLTTAEFEHQFNHIYAQSEPSPAVGALTSLPRDQGAKARENLLAASPSNAHALKEIESSSFLVNLDNATPVTLEERSRQFWHGDGANRWYDKPLQFIINDNGTAGFQGEHSMMDGTPTHRLCDTLNGLIVHNKLDFDNPTVRSTLSPPTVVRFDVDAKVAEDIASAQKQFAQLIAAHDLRVQAYEGYGKGLIKKFKCSPDAFVQVVIQLAYHKFYGKNRPTYESGATRKYQLGRTETVRSVTDESVAFCNAMSDAQVSRAELERLFRAAVAVHVKNTLEASDGRGVDRHLFGLKKSLLPGEEVPALFTDPAYAYSSTWFISSSQLSSEYFNGYGWSQVVDAGWGLAYMIKEDSLQWNVVSKRLGCERMSFFLNEAASDIRSILLPSLEAPKAKL